MTALQAAIGTLNDLIDAPADALAKPAKPIPAGLVSRRAAQVVLVAAVTLGLVLAAPSGIGLVVLALVVLAIGASYDRWAKGTAWSWLPFAVGIPILPIYGWYGATGALEPWFAGLVPMGVLAGAGLAVANARADAERDAAGGVGSVAVALGGMASWIVNAATLGAALAIALAWLPAVGEGSVATWATILPGLALVALGLGLGAARSAALRERGWQAQAIGVALVAVTWIAAVALPGA
jgi:4-hydroxybenzoate polyprenyltransferase